MEKVFIPSLNVFATATGRKKGMIVVKFSNGTEKLFPTKKVKFIK
jgi:hypothetical protein